MTEAPSSGRRSLTGSPGGNRSPPGREATSGSGSTGRSTGADARTSANGPAHADGTPRRASRTDGGQQGSGSTDGRARTDGTRILVVDNYDSFAYNLVQYVGAVTDEVVVRRNDEIDVEDVLALDPTGVVVSPGPGTPEAAGVSIPLFERTDLPILGVCLGHQALCAANGAPVVHAPRVVHGKPSVIDHDGRGIFESLPERLQVGRYHSLAIERSALPGVLVETATTADERAIVMAVRHREKPHVGVQFHPESILTRPQDESTDSGDGNLGDETSTGDDIVGNEMSTGDGIGGNETSTGEPDISLTVGTRMIENFCSMARAHRTRPHARIENAGETG